MKAITYAAALLCATALTAPVRADDFDVGAAAAANITASADYTRDWALAAINMGSAYNAGWLGNGTVAVFDTGINDANADLKSQILATSFNAALGTVAAAPTDPNGHGTFVAGLIADPGTNAAGVVGVAPGDKLLSVQVLNSGGVMGLTDKQLASGITYATGKASVFNNSWNSAMSVQQLGSSAAAINMLNGAYANSIAAWQKAVAANAVVVWAAGNNSMAQPGFFAGLPELYSGLQAGWLVAVATDNTGKLASYSNACGLTAAYCMAAPGSNVVSTYVTTGLAAASGTSFAAPILSGAVSVLQQRWPGLTNAQILSILFNSATKTGIYANTAIYGEGMLNLGAAILPQGTVTVTAKTGTTAASSSVAVTSGALGGALAGSGAIVMVRDAYNRDYQTTLSQFVVAQPTAYDLRQGMTELGGSLRSVVKTDGVSLAMVGTPASPGMDAAGQAPKFVMALTEGHDTATVAHGLGSAHLFGGTAADVAGSGSLAKGEAASSAYLGMTGRDAWGTAWSTPFAGNTRLTVAGVYGTVMDHPTEWAQDSIDPTKRPSQAAIGGAAVRLSRDFDAGTVAFEGGLVHESNSVLGTVSEGSMALGSGADTGYVGVHGELPLVGTWSAFGRFEAGRSAVQGAANSMVSSMNNVTSDSWALGVTGTNTVTDHDRLSFLVSQPLRVNGGTANLSLPTAQDENGNVSYANVAQNVAAGGREMDLQVGYHLAVSDSQEVSTTAMLRSSPDNIQGARAEGVLMTRFKMDF